MLNQNTKKSPGIEFAICNCTEEMGMDNEPANKNLCRTYFYSWTSPLSL